LLDDKLRDVDYTSGRSFNLSGLAGVLGAGESPRTGTTAAGSAAGGGSLERE
jgi:hypothetical protein